MDNEKFRRFAASNDELERRNMFGLIVVIESQKKQIEKHCFGDCGKILVGAGYDSQIGEVALCKEIDCKYLDKQMDEAIGEINNEPLYLRKLKEQ